MAAKIAKGIFITIILGLVCSPLFAQWGDNFDDGNFTTNLEWVGDTDDFIIENGLLRLNAPAQTSSSSLAVLSNISLNASWSFFLRLNFNPSSSNYAKVYLMADVQDLTNVQNGYFIKIGGSPDEISLYKVVEGNETLIIDGADGRVGLSNVEIELIITRDIGNNWELKSKLVGESDFLSEGSVIDSDINTSSYFGLFCKYTSTRSTKFYFDDFVVNGSSYIDDEPPILLNYTTPSSTQITLLFNEPLDTVEAKLPSHFVLNDSILAQTITPFTLDSILLEFDSLQLVNTLEIKALPDVEGNSLDTTLQIIFVDPAPYAYRELVINEIFPDPNPQEDLPAFEFIELFNNSDRIIEVASWSITDGTKVGTLESSLIFPDSFLIICPIEAQGDYEQFGATQGISNWPSLNNGGDNLTLNDKDGNTIDSVNYTLSWYNDLSKDNGGWSLEQIYPNATCLDSCNWAASVNISGGTPGKINSVFDLGLDESPPILLGVSTPTNLQVQLIFNEALDSLSIPQSLFILNDSIIPLSVYHSTDTVLLSFSDSLTLKNTLNIQHVFDLANNELDTLITFYLLDSIPHSYRDVVINEVFPDPNPQEELPTFEFVELFNNSSKTINLNGWKYSDGTKIFTFPNQLIYPDSFLIICPAEAETEYQAYGETLGISNWPSLNNGGDSLTLIDNTGNPIDSLNYTNTWYNDASKSNGGWTLEQINSNAACLDSCNWAASVDISGGTPGRINSIFDLGLDETPPNLVNVSTPTNTQVQLIFNEELDSSVINLANYILNDSITPESVLYLNDSLLLSFVSPLAPINTLSISALSDLSSNKLDTLISFYLIDSIPHTYRDIVINELLPDPNPQEELPTFEFVELFNNSNKTINLNGWQYSDGTRTFTFPNQLIYPDSFLIICPVEAETEYQAYGETLGISNWPSLNNGGDSLTLIDNTGILIDSVNYSLGWYNDTSKDNGGWSLEQINPNSACLDSCNWAASVNISGGTPGRINSIFDLGLDETPPQITAVYTPSITQIALVFNESIEPTISIENFILNETQKPTAVNVSSDSILLEFGTNLELVNSLNVLSIADTVGNKMDSIFTVYYINPEPANYRNIVINEIFADPSPQEDLPPFEFVELLNLSDKIIDLKGWIFSDGAKSVELNSLLLFPDSFLIICSQEASEMYQEYGKTIGLDSWPSLNNSGEKLSIISKKGVIIDSLTFNKAWYKNTAKNEGGWSLEQVNPLSKCLGEFNWAASTDIRGGTPGKANSLFSANTDVDPPQITQALLTDKLVEVWLTKPVAIGLYQGLISSLKIEVAFDSKEPLSYLTGVIEKVAPLNKYNIEIPLQDCNGNNGVASAILTNISFSTTKDIIINEILFDPYSGGADFVEVYNNSEHYFNLKNYLFANATNKLLLSDTTLLLKPKSFLAFSEDIVFLKNEYLAPDSTLFQAQLPTMPNDEGIIRLISSRGITLDSVYYSEDYHFSLINDVEGISLERISSQEESINKDNWRSAAESTNYATPGYENSQSQVATREGSITVFPQVITPNNDGQADFTQIGYSLDGQSQTISITVYNLQGQLVKTITNNSIIAPSGFFTWDGTNQQGGILPTAHYIIVSEIITSDGRVLTYRNKVVVANGF